MGNYVLTVGKSIPIPERNRTTKNGYDKNKVLAWIEDYKKTLGKLTEFNLGTSEIVNQNLVNCLQYCVFYRFFNLDFDNHYRKAYNLAIVYATKLYGYDKNKAADMVSTVIADSKRSMYND